MPGVKWRVIHVAKSAATAQKLIALLESEGFLARLAPLDSEENASSLCEIKVLAAEAEEARDVLIERGFE